MKYFMVLLLCCPLVSQAALIDTYYPDSQTELEYLFESGQIDLEQYNLLDEYYSSFPSVGRYDFTTIVNLVSTWSDYMDSLLAEYESLENPDEVYEQTGHPSFFSGLKSRLSYRIYQDFDNDKSHRQLLLLRGKLKDRFSYYIETEKTINSGDYYCLKRNLTLSYGNIKIEFGNFMPDRGMGVTLGYHSEFLEKSDNPRFKSLMFPARGRYNGIRFEYDGQFRPLLLLSYDRSKEFRGRLLSGGVDYHSRRFIIGVISSYYLIDNLGEKTEYEGLIIGSHVRWSCTGYKIQAEISESGYKYFAWNFLLERKYDSGMFSFSAWDYHRKYRNPYGAGKANSDYSTVYYEDSVFGYRSRQNGEWGVLTKTGMRISNGHSLGITANYWSNGGKEEKLRSRFSDCYALSKSFDGMITYLWGDDNLDADYGDRQHLRFDLIYSDGSPKRFRISTELKRIYYSTGRKDYLRVEIKAAYPISDDIESALKISRIDSDLGDGAPGYWYLFLSEEVAFGDSLFGRINIDTKEGKNYDLVQSARFNLALTLLTG